MSGTVYVHDLDQHGTFGPDAEKVFQPDILLGTQVGGGGFGSPERRLLVAVLSCALMDAEDGSLNVGMKLRRQVQYPRVGSLSAMAEKRRGKAREYILSQDRSHPMTFERLCELLDLEPDYVRRKVVDRWR